MPLLWSPRVAITTSEQETRELARQFGETLCEPSVVLLYGDLGSGKTAFTRGLVVGLEVADPGLVRSPSFTLVNVYSGRLPVYHVDLYRVETERDLETIGIDELLAEDAIVIVEWAGRLRTPPEAAWKVTISDLGGDSRKITFSRE